MTNALAAFPLIPAYSISKAAAFNLTQSLRALLAGRGVRVHAVPTGFVDTDMTRSVDMPKASPESVARAISARLLLIRVEHLVDRQAEEPRDRERQRQRGQVPAALDRDDRLARHA